jgi:catechol 2,3-dioxygenase-like lactoylglutathione lyase family enzyme
MRGPYLAHFAWSSGRWQAAWMQLGLVTIVVREYDEAIEFFVGGLGFDLVEDRADGTKRWVVVRPPGAQTGILLARGEGDEQRLVIGRQTAGRVALFLEVDDFAAAHQRMSRAGVHFLEDPRHEPYGIVAVFEDLCGNRWDLIERAADAAD